MKNEISLLNEQVNRVRQIMGLTNPHNFIIESRQTEEISINLLRKQNIDNPEEIVKQFVSLDMSDNQKNIPIMSYLYFVGNKGDNVTNIEMIANVVNEYNTLLEKKHIKPIQLTRGGLVIGDKIFDDFLKFSEYIHGVSSTRSVRQKTDTESVDFKDSKPVKKTLWSGNNIDIYEGNSVGKCIEYTQGGLVDGKYYSFCIGHPNPSSNMYKSYRDTKQSSFYFIVDRNKSLNDPLHIIVFDRTNDGIELTDENNTTGEISEYGQDVDGYVDYLKSKGVPVDELLVNRPKTAQERYEDELFKMENGDLNWFMNLDNPKNPNYKKPDLEPGQSEQNYYKSAYIGRGYILSDKQFDFLMGI